MNGSRSNDTLVELSTPRAQILVSDTIPQQKEPGLLGEKADSRTVAGNDQDNSEALYSARK